MRRLSFTLITALIVVALTASAGVASTRILSISFTAVGSFNSVGTLAKASGDDVPMAKGGKVPANQELCADACTGMFLEADGKLVGLGPTDATVVIEATGTPVVNCTNNGGNQAPGQNPPNITTSGEQQIGVTQITKNGSAQIDVTTELPDVNLPGSQMGCPNDNWTATIVGIQFTNATVSVFQDGILTAQQSYVF